MNELKASGNATLIPADLVTASGSGLDPDISIASAQYQAERVATARQLALPQIQAAIDRATSPRTLGLLGENRVNVLELNRILDRLPPDEE